MFSQIQISVERVDYVEKLKNCQEKQTFKNAIINP